MGSRQGRLLTGRAAPGSKEEVESWDANVVASLQSCTAGRGKAHGIAEAAVLAGTLKGNIVCTLNSRCRRDYSAEDCQQLARFVAFTDLHLRQGHRVVVHCRQGQHRTGVAIYLVLRSMAEEPAQCLSLMKEMRPAMHKELLLKTKYRHLIDKAETIFESPEFRAGLTVTVA